jgi:hypothetical protein
MKHVAPFVALFCSLAGVAHAELLSEAVSAFPARTTALEYDALSTLRALPNYKDLRKQYSGEGLQRAQKDLLLLGVSEDQLSEVVTAAGPNGFFGLLAGSFQSAAAAKEAVKNGMAQTALDDGPAFCSKDGNCFLLPSSEEGHILFGTLGQLKAISDVRQSRAQSLRVNAMFMELISRADLRAPVIGIAPGSEIGLWVGDSIPQALSSRIDMTKLFSTIESFAYTVKLDSKAHVGLNLFCTSDQSGTWIKDALSAASGLQRAAAAAAGSGALGFNNMVVSSNGRLVAVNLDAPIQ